MSQMRRTATVRERCSRLSRPAPLPDGRGTISLRRRCAYVRVIFVITGHRRLTCSASRFAPGARDSSSLVRPIAPDQERENRRRWCSIFMHFARVFAILLAVRALSRGPIVWIRIIGFVRCWRPRETRDNHVLLCSGKAAHEIFISRSSLLYALVLGPFTLSTGCGGDGGSTSGAATSSGGGATSTSTAGSGGAGGVPITGSGGAASTGTLSSTVTTGSGVVAISPCQGHIYQCGDLLDNDGDGLVDSEDPDCLGPCDNTEGDSTAGSPDRPAPPAPSIVISIRTRAPATTTATGTTSAIPTRSRPGITRSRARARNALTIRRRTPPARTRRAISSTPRNRRCATITADR